MKGVMLEFDESAKVVNLRLEPSQFAAPLVVASLMSHIRSSEYGGYFISEKAVKAASDKANHLFKTKQAGNVVEQIAERRDAELAIKIANDGLTATLQLTTPHGGTMPTLDDVKAVLQRQQITRGIGTKRIHQLLEQAQQAAPGSKVEGVIARGLAARPGRNSKFVPLVPNALERILRPQSKDGKKVDMRDLGEIVCVKANTPLLRRTSPGKGRSGFTVTGERLSASGGDWVDLKPGAGTHISERDPNLLLSSIAGMPKFKDNLMQVDDTFDTKGVNVGTGHINYDGAVLVNGDVTEKMVVKASGDVTINGFVESARIEAGGDIIITQGAVGKFDGDDEDHSCILKAGGSVFLQHGQGLLIEADQHVVVQRQLSHSEVRSKGTVTIGQVDKPMGTVFACSIQARGAVSAGTIGAISGSSLVIDFSEGLQDLQHRKEVIDERLEALQARHSAHKEKLDRLAGKVLPKDLRLKVAQASEALKKETELLERLSKQAEAAADAKLAYQKTIKVLAYKKLFAGVTVKLNQKNWRSERECERASVTYDEARWHYEPMVN